MTHPAFDELIHAPHRLRAMATLAAADSVDFATLRDLLGVADSVLSKHLKALQEAGYVTLDKRTGLGGRTRTWVRSTPEGRTAYEAHVAALRELFDHPDGAV